MLLMKQCAVQFPALVLIALGVSIANAQKAPIEITADLSDAPRKLFHAEIDFPVSAGPLTLISPEWIPGHHMPSGPANAITGVVFTANGKPLEWRRDDVNLYEFHLTISRRHHQASDYAREGSGAEEGRRGVRLSAGGRAG
jgi:hypothetical protein